jgi:hypothetical protein
VTIKQAIRKKKLGERKEGKIKKEEKDRAEENHCPKGRTFTASKQVKT